VITLEASTCEQTLTAWLRVWTRTLLLAFLTWRPLPAVPSPLRSGWAGVDPGTRASVLGIIAERAVTARAAALRRSYREVTLIRVLEQIATDLLDGRPAPRTAGQCWVPPQLRWAHEAERVGWNRDDGAAADCVAPPLDFALAGLPDWPGIPAAERLRLLLGHPRSPRAECNREMAAAALFGEDGQAVFEAELAADLAVALAVTPYPCRLAEATILMDCPGQWLLTVMRWAGCG
jgi:hypothetical protein